MHVHAHTHAHTHTHTHRCLSYLALVNSCMHIHCVLRHCNWQVCLTGSGEISVYMGERGHIHTVFAYTYGHMHLHMQKHTHLHTHTHMYTQHTYIHACMLVPAPMHTNMHTHTHTHTYTHTHANTHTHKHTHTHTNVTYLSSTAHCEGGTIEGRRGNKRCLNADRAKGLDVQVFNEVSGGGQVLTGPVAP